MSAALAVADRLRSSPETCRLLFLTSRRSVDKQIMSAWLEQSEKASPEGSGSSVRIYWEAVSSSPAEGILGRFRYFLNLVSATVRSFRLLRHHNVRLVVGLGGFASVPGVLAAVLQRIPVVLIEQNVVPGRANRLLSRIAKLVCTGWPVAPKWQLTLHAPLLITGVPIRLNRMIECHLPVDQSVPANDHNSVCKKLLIVGGSQGAHKINQIVMASVKQSPEVFVQFDICHQAGAADAEALQMSYKSIGTRFRVVPFIEDILDELSRSDIVISRAGAMTLAEIQAAGKSAILIPLSTSADNHQNLNARHFCSVADAVFVDEGSKSATSDLIASLRRFSEYGCFRDKASTPDQATCVDSAALIAEQIVKYSRS